MDMHCVVQSQKWKALPLKDTLKATSTQLDLRKRLLTLVLVSSLLIVLCPSVYEAKLSEYIHDFESLDYASVRVQEDPVVERTRRHLLSEDQEDRHRYHSHRQTEDRIVKIDFEALGRKFKLRLKPDARSVFADDLAVEGSDGNPIPLTLDHIYSGHLEDTANSHVFGSVSDGIFEGKILTPEGTFYVERSHKYFKFEPESSQETDSKYYPEGKGRRAKQSNNETQDVDLYDFDDVGGFDEDNSSPRKQSVNSSSSSSSAGDKYSYKIHNLTVTSTSPVNVVLLKDSPDHETTSTASTTTSSPTFHSVIYSSEAVKHPLLEKALGSGCASNIDPEVSEWMEKISNSVVREEIDPVSHEKNTDNEEEQFHPRNKRSPARDISGGVFGREPLQIRPGFSQSSRDHPKDDSHTNIWTRNAQSRISHERKDFYPSSSTIPSHHPGSTVRKRACSLYIQTDTYLWEHIRKDASTDSKAREEIASLVAQHIKAVNHIYENSDFNGIRGLKFIVQRLRINDTSSCDTSAKRDQNQFCSPNIDVSNFLNLNSQFNHNDFCLAYIFTYRDFSGGTLGLAWVASTSGASGGICEKYKSYTENIHGRQVQTKRSLNTGIITFVNYNSRVPPKVSELTLAHEIGHNFGSPHDYPMDCRPGGTQGNFIMYSSATSGERPNNNKFSPCSVRNISSVLGAVFNSEGKENCFQEDDGPFCGNKIVEEGEECDCGYDNKECTEMCCYPREIEPYLESEPGAKPCTRRRGALCSPSEGPCCSEKCRYETNDKQCRHETECTLESFCNGYRAVCPAAPAKANKTECNGGTQVCWSGACVGSICQKYEMEECFLTSRSGAKPDEMCEVACQRTGDMFSCRRTSEIPQMRNISGLKLRPGSPCNDFQGYCDVFQRCRAVDAEGPLAMLKNLLFNHYTLSTIKQWATTYWWACMLMGVGLMIFMAAFVKCCAVHTPSSNPKKKPALRISDTLRRPADTLRRKRHRSQGRSGHHSQGHASIPLQPSVPPDLAGPSSSSYPPPHPQHALPPLPTSAPPQSQASGIMCHTNFQVHAPSSSSGMMTSQQHHSIPYNPQLVVSLPPESRNNTGGQPYLPEPPPPYPGHPPPLPSRPSTTSSASSAAPLRPNLPSSAAIAGPNHGYGEGRGHYNRRSNTHSGGTVFASPANYPAAGSKPPPGSNKSSKTGHR